MSIPKAAHPRKRNARVAAYLIWAVVATVGLTFAAVPVYWLYVKATRYGGIQHTPDARPAAVLRQRATVQFDSNTAPNLPWTFKPLQGTETLRIGQLGVAYFHVQNNASVPVAAVASFNIVPFSAAAYFKITKCFCFTKQTLAAGEGRDFSVTYFIDPAIAKDGDNDGINALTLSYTLFRRDDLVVDK